MAHALAPNPHTLTRARAVQLAREEEVHKKTVALLAERVKELEQVKSKLGSTEQDVEQKASELKTAAAEKAVLADEALAKQAELKEAAELITGLETELEMERSALGEAQKAKAQARWNLSAGKEKAEAFNRKLKFQGNLRQQMVAKTAEERESLVAELVRERKEKEEMARARLETVEQLKMSLNSQIDAVLGNLKVEMGDAEHAASKETSEITKIAVQKKKASIAPAASPAAAAAPAAASDAEKPAPPKKSGSILGSIGNLFGMNQTTEEGAEEAAEKAAATAPADEEADSEAAIKAAVSSMVSSAVASAAADATKADAAPKSEEV